MSGNNGGNGRDDDADNWEDGHATPAEGVRIPGSARAAGVRLAVHEATVNLQGVVDHQRAVTELLGQDDYDDETLRQLEDHAEDAAESWHRFRRAVYEIRRRRG